MDKQLIERLALETHKQFFADEVHKVPIEELTADLSEEEKERVVKIATRFLSAVDAERGKEAVATVLSAHSPFHGVQSISCVEEIPVTTKLFLAPQPAIPEGMALHAKQLAEVLMAIKDEFFFAEIDAHHPEVHAIRKLKDTLFAKLKKIVAAAGVAP